MPILYAPRPGQILMCNFDVSEEEHGYQPPEMVKTRPVIALTGHMASKPGLVTVVPISSIAPNPIFLCHCDIPKRSLPNTSYFGRVAENWVKGDMIYTVAFHRLDFVRLPGKNTHGDRLYYKTRLGRDKMREIYTCVLHGINLGDLSAHL